ncbi:hypothetical protein D8675_16395 [Enterobacter roggenkampii]|nr:hypothetical protein D8675_16395 [Enterobacter roggenkampii]
MTAPIVKEKQIYDAASRRLAKVKVTHRSMKRLYYGFYEYAFSLRSPAWNCSKSTVVLKVDSSAGGTTPPL